MTTRSSQALAGEFRAFVEARSFPCVGAKSALNKDQATFLSGTDMTSGADDERLLHAFYDFVRRYRRSPQLYTTFVALFEGPLDLSEKAFEQALWQRLASLHEMDRQQHGWDAAVSSDPASPHFSFSLMEEAFFVVGLHPQSSRTARRFGRPTLVFNLHDQFERLRTEDRYETLRDAVIERDAKLDGAPNPMLAGFGEASEARQYSGRKVGASWRCPFSPQPGERA